MLAEERERYILEKLNIKGVINVSVISSLLKVSESTIRRDLERLEEAGQLIRIHGGAKINENSMDELEIVNDAQLTMNAKIVLNYDIKRKICERASEVVKENQCVFIDGGTSLFPLIDYLVDKDIIIVTQNDLAIRRVGNARATIINIGGKYLPQFSMSVGTTAINEIKKFHFDHCFLGCNCVDFETMYSYTLEQDTLEVKLAAYESSRHKHLLIDKSKLNNKGFCKLANLRSFDTIFCDTFEVPKSLNDRFVLV